MVARNISKRRQNMKRNGNGNSNTRLRRPMSKNKPNTARVFRPSNRSRAGGSSGMFRGVSTQVQVLSGYDFISTVAVPTQLNDSNAVLLDVPTAPAALSGTRWAQLAAMYEKYRFLKATMVYVPSVSSVVGSQMISYWELDPLDSFGNSGNLQTDLRVAMAHQNAKLHNIYDNVSIDMPLRTGINDFFVERGITTAEDNPRWTQQARFRMIASSGATGFFDNGATEIGAGSVYLAWTCKFLNPQIQPSLVVPNLQSTTLAIRTSSNSVSNCTTLPYKPSSVDAIWNRPGSSDVTQAPGYSASQFSNPIRYYDVTPEAALRESAYTAGNNLPANLPYADGTYRLCFVSAMIKPQAFGGDDHQAIQSSALPALRETAFYTIRGPSVPDSLNPQYITVQSRVAILSNTIEGQGNANNVKMAVAVIKISNGEILLAPAEFDPNVPGYPSMDNVTWAPGHASTGSINVPETDETTQQSNEVGGWGLPELIIEVRDGVTAIVRIIENVVDLVSTLANPIKLGFKIFRTISNLFFGAPKAFTTQPTKY